MEAPGSSVTSIRCTSTQTPSRESERWVPPGADVAMTYLIMASSDLDAVPWWIRPAAWSLRKVFLRRFQAAVRDDPGPYLAQVARYRLADVNVRPAEAARLLRLAEGNAGDSEGVIRG